MQTLNSYLYDNFIHVLLIGSDSIATEDRIVYSREIKLYQGINNQIKLKFLNQDQKKVDVTGYSIQANLFDVQQNQILISNSAVLNSNVSGIANVTFSSSQLDTLTLGQYQLTLVGINPNGIATVLYIDDNYTTRLPVELLVGPGDALKAPINLTFQNATNNKITSQIVDLTKLAVDSHILSLQANLTAYSGNLLVQAALTTTPVDSDFGNLSITNYSNYSGPILNTVTGSYSALRVVLDHGNVAVPASLTVNSAMVRY